MCKFVCSDAVYTRDTSVALRNLQEKVSFLESKGFRALGPAQVIMETGGNVVAYITMQLG